MTRGLLVDGAAMGVSILNAIVQLWLGATVLLNAERRTWGVWLAGISLLTGGAFFLGHSALLDSARLDGGLRAVDTGMDRLWWAAPFPPLALPLAWYAAVLWHTGYWEGPTSAFHRRHRIGLGLLLAVGAGIAGLLLVAPPLPAYASLARLNFPSMRTGGSPSPLTLAYPAYIAACIGMALDALLRPGPSGRTMGEVARLRARPWLIAASIALLLVSLLIGAGLAWLVTRVRGAPCRGAEADAAVALAGFDLLVSSLIAGANLCLGQAIVSYEIFTGKALPRRGLLRYWQSVVLLGGGYGALVGWDLAASVSRLDGLLAAAVLMAFCFSLFIRRSYADRERYIEEIHSFLAVPRLYERVIDRAGSSPEIDLRAPFGALCGEVLGARLAYLAALGPPAALIGPTIAYPADAPRDLPWLGEVAAALRPREVRWLALDPGRHGGIVWAVPLRSEGGPVGALLLGERRDGGLYAQEEMEVARAAGERLIDAGASAELARRLMVLQRQRMAESGVLDRRARRVLHDDILPMVHAVLLQLSGDASDSGDCPKIPSQTSPKVRPQSGEIQPQSGEVRPQSGPEALMQLAAVHRAISDLLRQTPVRVAPGVAQAGLFGAIRAAVEEMRGAFEEVEWRVDSAAERLAERLPLLTSETLYFAAREAIRNAARHGCGHDGSRPFRLWVSAAGGDGLEIRIEDNGVGMAPDGQAKGGRQGDGSGQGLALHSTMMAVLGGALTVESAPGEGVCVRLLLPIDRDW